MPIDRSKLKLADGSSWNSESVIDSGGAEVSIDRDGKLWLNHYAEPHAVDCDATDALAVIRANGLDPEYEALQALVAALKDDDTYGLSESGMCVHEALKHAAILLGCEPQT